MLLLQFAQLQFILITIIILLSSYIFGVQMVKQEYQDYSSNGNNVTAVGNVNMPGKYYVHGKQQQQQQQQQQKLKRNELEKQMIISSTTNIEEEKSTNNNITKLSSLQSLPLSTTLPSSILRKDVGWTRQQPLRNFFGIFNRNNAPQTPSVPGENTQNTNNNNNNNNVQAHDTLITCACRCGERNDESRIVGGQTTGVSEYPWMARLSYFHRFYCGGTLINDRYVLTAAHCVKGFMWFMIKVTFGEHDRCSGRERPETRFVLRAFSQKFSFSNFENDIALLRLNDRVPINSFIRPICLPRADERNDLFIGTKAITTGWGTLKEDGKPSCVLQEVEVPVLDNNICITQTNYTHKMITRNMMCAGYPGKGERDACQGDSGGPLVRMRPDDKRFEQIGVVSWGNGCARPNYPGVYTRVTRYLDWIIDNSRDGCFCNDKY